MSLPSYTDYQDAVLNPAVVFQNDPELKSARVEVDGWGRARVRSGNFAYTYRLENGRQRWAVRCFSKYVPEQSRYEAVGRFLSAHPTSFLLRTDYLPRGIMIKGSWHPLIKMDWAEGDTLGEYVERHVADRGAMARLRTNFQEIVSALDRLGAAHGDLQHGNILVRPDGRLVLVDYDGFYVPELAGRSGMERGHRHYQHPARDKEFGPDLDRFSAIAIDLALAALALDSGLLRRYNTGENLLFKQEDYRQPQTSALLTDLETLPGLAPLVGRLRMLCRGNLAQVPRLDRFLAGEMAAVAPRPEVAVRPWESYPIFWSSEREKLFDHLGEHVTVVGQVTSYWRDKARNDKPYVFLTFGDWKQGAFRLVAWSETMDLFRSQDVSLSGYTDAWVSVTGLLVDFAGGGRRHPQIVIERPSQIEVLQGGRAEAERRVAAQSTSPSTGSPAAREAAQPVVGVRSPGVDLPRAGLEPAPAVRRAGTPAGPDAVLARIPDAHPEAYISPPRAPVIRQRHTANGHDTSPTAELAQEYFKRGVRHRQQNELDRAIQDYRRAIELDPNLSQAHNNLGWAYRLQGQLDQAIGAFRAAVQADPGYLRAQVNLGWALVERSDYEEAIRVLEAACRAGPQEAGAHFYLGWAYEQRGRLDRAIRAYRQAIALDPAHDEAHLHLGCVCQRKGQADAALQAYLDAVAANPQNADAHFVLSMAHKGRGSTHEARKALEQAAKLGHAKAKEVLGNTQP